LLAGETKGILAVRFLCDEMLKRLGHWLRAAGYDVLMLPDGTRDRLIIERAREEGRVLLTRDRKMVEHKTAGKVLLLDCRDLEDCVEALGRCLAIDWLHRPFSRCLACNTPLILAPPERSQELPPGSRAAADRVLLCPHCQQLFWHGSHVVRMRERLAGWQRQRPKPGQWPGQAPAGQAVFSHYPTERPNMTHPLFAPYQLKSLKLNNRTVMAPMTRCRAGEGDAPTPLMAEYYAQRASAGLIVSEGTPVSAEGRGYLWTPGIYTSHQVTGWEQVAEAVHGAGGRLFVQLWHVGRISHHSLQPRGGAPAGPTDVQAEGALCFAYDDSGSPGYMPTSRPMALDAAGIARVRDAFAQAARNARAAGMDGVEVHGANGYLFDQFLNAEVNSRTDDYGGTVENRCRLLLETIDGVCDAIGADRTGVRISPNGRFNAMPEDTRMEETFLHLAAELDRRSIAYLHINDQATFGLPSIPEGLIQKLRSAFRGPVILCGGYDAARARDTIDQGLADLIAFGVPFIANPDLPARLEQGWPLNEPRRDLFYGGGAQGYTDYPVYPG
jgi:N-ethylmaleimide reductase